MVLRTVESQEVPSAIHDLQCHSDLVSVLAVDGQLDVAGHSQSVVHTQHSLIDVYCSQLEVQSLKEGEWEEGRGGEGMGRH